MACRGLGPRNSGPPQPAPQILACDAVGPRVGRDALDAASQGPAGRWVPLIRSARECGFPWLPFSGTTVMRRADLWSVISLSISAGRGSNILHRGTTERTRPGARAHYGRGSRQA